MLQEEEESQTIRFKRLETGTLRERARNKIDVYRDFEILKAKNVFLQNSIDLEEFVTRLSNLLPNCENY